MKKILFIFIQLFIALLNVYTQETITISGRVTNFERIPIDSYIEDLQYVNFENIVVICSDKNRFYKLENLEKGKCLSMNAMRYEEYSRMNEVPERDMFLEFWVWNVITDRDLTINPHYQKFDFYGMTPFMSFGAYQDFFIFFRPMSLTKSLLYSKDIYINNKATEKFSDISIKPSYLKMKIFADHKELKVNSIIRLEEFLEKAI